MDVKMIICRVCLDNKEKLIRLTSDDIDGWSIVHMLNEFTIINAEPQLPKYICEVCSGQLDIAYAFKRRYEDSIVKYIRQTSYREELEAATYGESSSSVACDILSQTDDPVDSKQSVPMHSNHPVVNDLTVEDEFEAEEMKFSPNFLLVDNPTLDDDVERLISDDSISESKHEMAEDDVQLIENHSSNGEDVFLIESDSNDGSVHEALDEIEAVQEALLSKGNEHSKDHGAESERLSDQLNNRKTDDATRNLFATHFYNTQPEPIEPTKLQSEIEEENQLRTVSLQCTKTERPQMALPNIFESAADSKVPIRKWRILRSNRRHAHDLGDWHKNSLSKAVLSKIYTYHYSNRKKPFQCDVCCRWFKTKGHIKTHRMRHIETMKRIKCDKCLLTFLTKPHFKNHKCTNLSLTKSSV